MRYLRFILLPLLLIACSDQQPAAPDLAPTFAISDAPAASGIVLRGEFAYAAAVSDARTGLQVIVGADMDEFCAGTINFEVLPVQTVYQNNGRALWRLAGTQHATVWDFVEFDCSLFTTRDPVASGEASVRITDNDPFIAGGNFTNSFGFMVNGELTRATGEPATIAAHYRAQYRNGVFYRIVSQVVNLH